LDFTNHQDLSFAAGFVLRMDSVTHGFPADDIRLRPEGVAVVVLADLIAAFSWRRQPKKGGMYAALPRCRRKSGKYLARAAETAAPKLPFTDCGACVPRA
jgi:hypothetical protein